MSSAQSQSKHHHHTADATERERKRETVAAGSDMAQIYEAPVMSVMSE